MIDRPAGKAAHEKARAKYRAKQAKEREDATEAERWSRHRLTAPFVFSAFVHNTLPVAFGASLLRHLSVLRRNAKRAFTRR